MEEDIKQCIKTLNEGGLILYPTDTIWGIGCDATNVQAVERVYALKNRPDSKSMLVLLPTADLLDHYVVDVPEMARELIDVAVKPLTLILDGAFNVAPKLLGDNDSLGIRVPQDAFCQRLCQAFGKPIVSTSANVSGKDSPALFSEIDDNIKTGVDYIVGYRQDDDARRKPSNIIKLQSNGTFKILR